jgi:hypothetical protein
MSLRYAKGSMSWCLQVPVSEYKTAAVRPPRSLRHEATASGRVTRRASSDPACIASPNDIGSPPGEAPPGWRASLCTSGRTCPMCGGTARTTS